MTTYVLDTSVLLSDPGAVGRFDEHDVVLPLVVISELEGKRDHPELGWFARQSLRMLDELRIRHGRLDEALPVGNGTVRVELNHVDTSALPAGFRGDSGDSRILAVAANLSAEGLDVVLVTKDLPLRVKAASIGLTAQEYRAELAVDTGHTGMAELEVAAADLDALYLDGHLDLEEARELPCHTGLVLLSPRGSGLGRVAPDKSVRLVRGDRDAFGVHGRSAEQRVAIDLLLDPEVGIVSLGGRAGTGKSALALCAGLESVLERRAHKKVVVFRPLYAVGGQELGYLPGDAGEKMGPWAQAVFDTLGALVAPEVVEEVMARGLLEVLPLTHIRGRSLHDAFVIVDEAQSLERGVLLTVLSRLGQGSRVVLTHDVAQRDNLRVGRHDGVAAVIEALKGHPLFAHVTLTRSERSPIAALVTEMLEDLPL
ncbi:MAG: putative phosphate starvation-inducible protein ATP-binding PhoH [Frankiales bacterium]|jgi:PhoH-like ATPase|nr:putative phosphate starvation-inducible protein ATP-binding PhoH [Frankiales bacterium]